MRHAPRPALRLAALLLCLALPPAFAACSHIPRMLGGSANVELQLDGEQQHQTDLPVGKTLTLDMRDPGASGYLFAGTSFNPDLLRLDSIIPFEEGTHVRYVFTTLAEGQCDIIIKINRKEPGYRPDIFKMISVTITK
ncbi:MAG: hypothetical protein P4L39_04210 [Humidesulfovibrio sp.]|nr:hypothetical protein [Humidesulfovibrio sp.]